MRESLSFYEALPKRTVELVDGQLIIGGHLSKTAMMMAFIIEGYGAEYVANIISKDLLRDAVIEVYGKNQDGEPLADFSPTDTFGIPFFQFKQEVNIISFFKEKGIKSLGNGYTMKLGNDGFSPDLMIVKNENAHRFKDYYFDGAPDLVLEYQYPSPIIQDFDKNVRFPKYAKAGIPEIWHINYITKQVDILILNNGEYQKVDIQNDLYESISIKGITLKPSLLFEAPRKAIQVDIKNQKSVKDFLKHKKEDTVTWGSIPFHPNFDLEPVPVSFEEYIAWTGEPKFEFMPQPIFGGGDKTTREYLGVAALTLGVKEVVKYLPKEEWSKVL